MTATPDVPTVTQALSAVMEDVRAVGKDGRNQQQNYVFRGIDGVVNAVGPAMRKHGVIVLPEVLEVSYRDCLVGKNQTPQRECTVRVKYVFYGPAGDSVSAIVEGEALDSGDKATAKAFSVAFRICLLQSLTIPTDEPDPDEHNAERASSVPAEPTSEEIALQDKAIALAATLNISASDVMKVARAEGWSEAVRRLEEKAPARA
jgi:hypothetical protein